MRSEQPGVYPEDVILPESFRAAPGNGLAAMPLVEARVILDSVPSGYSTMVFEECR